MILGRCSRRFGPTCKCWLELAELGLVSFHIACFFKWNGMSHYVGIRVHDPVVFFNFQRNGPHVPLVEMVGLSAKGRPQVRHSGRKAALRSSEGSV